MFRFRHALALLALVLAGCRSSTGPAAAQVRLRNATPWVLTDVSFSYPGDAIELARLAPGESSPYERRESPYPYGNLTATANGAVRRVQTIDFMGAEPLPAGRYTYVVELQPAMPDSVDVRLERDGAW